MSSSNTSQGGKSGLKHIVVISLLSVTFGIVLSGASTAAVNISELVKKDDAAAINSLQSEINTLKQQVNQLRSAIVVNNSAVTVNRKLIVKSDVEVQSGLRVGKSIDAQQNVKADKVTQGGKAVAISGDRVTGRVLIPGVGSFPLIDGKVK